MTDCIFCKIISKEIPSDMVFEDDFAVAFMDIRPVSHGHLLVVPKEHVTDILSSSDETVSQLLPLMKRLGKGVIAAVGAAGCNITFNTGEAAGQTVFHLHGHVIPRFSNDGLKPWPHMDEAPQSRAEMAEKIKKHL